VHPSFDDYSCSVDWFYAAGRQTHSTLLRFSNRITEVDNSRTIVPRERNDETTKKISDEVVRRAFQNVTTVTGLSIRSFLHTINPHNKIFFRGAVALLAEYP